MKTLAWIIGIILGLMILDLLYMNDDPDKGGIQGFGQLIFIVLLVIGASSLKQNYKNPRT